MEGNVLDRYIRKYRSILRVSGLAVIVFGIWSIIKGVLSTLIDTSYLMIDEKLLVPVIVIVAVVVCVDLAFRLIVGIGAISEGRGEKRSAAYLVLVGIMILFSMVSLFFTIATSAEKNIIELIVELLVEGTSMFSLIEVMVFSIKLRKKLGEKEQMQ